MFSSKLFIHRLGDASVLYLNYGRLDMLSHREYRFEHVNADNPILCCSRQSVLIGFSYNILKDILKLHIIFSGHILVIIFMSPPLSVRDI
jgi:hypothetical protein